MTDFKNGGVPSPDYDSEDINYVHKKTEFTNDVYVYGKLYANLVGGQPDVNIKDLIKSHYFKNYIGTSV